MKKPNNPLKVYKFLKDHPDKWFCDDCLSKQTSVNRHEINTIAWSFAFFPKEFSRASRTCGQNCKTFDKVCTLAISNAN